MADVRLVGLLAALALLACGGSLVAPADSGATDTARLNETGPEIRGIDGLMGVCGITHTARVVGTCRYDLPTPACARGEVYVAGQVILLDRTHEDGWDYVDGTMTSIELFGAACPDPGSAAEVDFYYSCILC